MAVGQAPERDRRGYVWRLLVLPLLRTKAGACVRMYGCVRVYECVYGCGVCTAPSGALTATARNRSQEKLLLSVSVCACVHRPGG